MAINPLEFIGPNTIKAGLIGLEKLGVGDFGNTVSELEHFSNNPLWIKHRVDNAQDKINEMWDEHKDDVEEFFNEMGENINEGWDCITENAGVFLEAASEFIESLW